MLSPCVSLCINDQDTKQCLGCGRTMQEKKMWKDPTTSDAWKEDNLNECKTRLTKKQLDYWVASYNFKSVHGKSMHKYGKELRNET